MTEPSRSDRLAKLRRQIILDAAERVFARDGLEQTTIRAIAREAGCTTGAIYPWFEGKEAIYGELLRSSLLRLLSHLDLELSLAAPAGAARAAIEGFFAYYADRETEFSLGLYLYRGLAPRGLGRETDEALNALLRQCVDRLGKGLAASKGWSAEQVAVEEINVFTYLMGLLLMHHTRRVKSLHQRADTLLDHYCLALEQR
ncbi:TetR/AcrR family transcriptional regulator [Bordetella avium]|uniref:TetR-family transcriptional regulator n=1 Tax=Bordetella avium (strain 197N) TaxID=360910 RepID=Q2KV26_BORA1|nr:TetR/AcrR family transcriptional regulator [Bordetella avium]AZY48541.1 TetR/AcrR family transcriptional regulator [Bordetella avium]AZY51921.1 TetR/AcrR family transcriptional regulator [Bordetella avium]RIQ13848.1 TetR/AcrR family transcriptional regulator [Bordetella avium]RIQ17078.1 TetR/AcrR family transcriptional regulator [Bordetella avium]RIQ36196.1 TetR/AcrR family transcriptional regulator [Bordetella avium]